MKLTKTQELALKDLRENGKLYISKNSPELLCAFNILVRNGLAVATDESALGKHYKAVAQ